MTTPGEVLPARPALWFALACEMASIGSRCTLALGLYREIRAVPASMTYLMFGIVKDVSATLVARMMRLLTPGLDEVSNTLCCSAAESLP